METMRTAADSSYEVGVNGGAGTKGHGASARWTERSIRLFVVNHITNWLPPTRLYGMKARMYCWAGKNVHGTARLVSSVSIQTLGDVAIGAHTFVGHEVLIAGGLSKITIGDHCDIAPRVTIVSGTHEIDMSGPRSAGPGKSAPIVIEDGVWIGAGAVVLPGVVIGKKSVIAAGSVVNRSIPPYVVAAGVPCRPIRQWDLASQQWAACDADISNEQN